jgi:hypothetical protein
VGRPPISWTPDQWKIFDAFCKAGAAVADVCEAMGHKYEQIDGLIQRTHGSTFSEYRETKRGWGRCAVFAKQLELALAGDRTMLIWVGKQMGQSDKQESKVTTLTHEEALAALDPEKE